MSLRGYMMLMLKHLSGSGSLMLFVRTHQQLQFYLEVLDTCQAANQSGIGSAFGAQSGANVIEIHPVATLRLQRRR